MNTLRKEKYIFIKNTKNLPLPLEVRKTHRGPTPCQGFMYVTRALPYHVDCMFDTIMTQCKPISLHIYEWVTFLEAKSGVLKMKWFLKNKMEALSVKI